MNGSIDCSLWAFQIIDKPVSVAPIRKFSRRSVSIDPVAPPTTKFCIIGLCLKRRSRYERARVRPRLVNGYSPSTLATTSRRTLHGLPIALEKNRRLRR
jgi:hypothetical protein